MSEFVQFEPLLPFWALALLGLGVVWMIRVAWRTGGVLAGSLRSIAAVALLGAMSGPVRIIHSESSMHPTLTLLVDTSRSMATCDAPSTVGAIARFDAVRPWLAPALLQRIADDRNLRVVAFDAGSRAMQRAAVREMAPNGDETNLVDALERAVSASASGADVVVFSDGADTSEASLDGVRDLAIAAGVAVSAVVPGDASSLPDASVTLDADRSFALAGERVVLTASVRARGIDGVAATLQVIERRPGADDRVVLERAVDLRTLERIRIDVTAEAPRPGGVGSVEFLAALAPGRGDSDPSNNTARAVVQVGDAPIRVLVFEARPSWETRFFLDALRADPRIEVTSVTVVGGRDRILVSTPNASPRQPPEEAPTQAASLERFDVVALGRGVERWFAGAQASTLASYAEHGGGLIFLRGDPVLDDEEARAQLERVSPVRWGKARLPGGRLFATFEGRDEAPVRTAAAAVGDPYLETMPDALATTLAEGERSLSTVWLRSDVAGADPAQRAPAAIAHMRTSRGASLAVLTDGLWRWAFAPPPEDDARRAYATFWAQAVRVLAGGADLPPGAELQVVAEPATVRPGEPVGLTIRARPGSIAGPVDLVMIAPDGAVTEAPVVRSAGVNRWMASVTPEADGVWRIVARAPSIQAAADAIVVVRTTDAERAAPSQADRLRALAEATGGSVLPIDSPEALGDVVGAPAMQTEIGESSDAIWQRPGVLVLISLALVAEWTRRRLMGGV